MSRRMDREGVYRMQPQGIANKRFTDDPRCKPNERGWVVPFANWQGWDALNRAIYGTRRTMILRRHMSDHERKDALRVTRIQIDESRRCDRPALP